MLIFDKLPVVQHCCFCCNLKIGCIIIAVYGIFNSSLDACALLIPRVCKSSGLFAWILHIGLYLTTVSAVLLLIASILFLIGIFMNRRITAMLFLYTTALSILIFMAIFICAILVSIFEKDCNVTIHLISIVNSLLLWTYFMIVVRSYKDEME